MTGCHHPPGLSKKRWILCGRDRAQRIADRMIDDGADCVSVIRTGNLLQPRRIVPSRVDDASVELEVRVA